MVEHSKRLNYADDTSSSYSAKDTVVFSAVGAATKRDGTILCVKCTSTAQSMLGIHLPKVTNIIAKALYTE